MSWFSNFLRKVFHIGCPAPTPPPPPTPVPTRPGVLFGYFDSDSSQAAATVDHCNVFMISGDGGQANHAAILARMTADMTAAAAVGYTKFVLPIDIFLWDTTPNPPYLERCRLRPTGIAELVAWRDAQEPSLIAKVVCLYPIDEPELHDLNTVYLGPVLDQVRAAWPGPKLGVIYGDSHNYPAIGGYDWVGVDNYGAGAGVLNDLPMITGTQQYILVPGGANPWRQDPQPFYDYAMQHANVAWLCPFLWITNDGIGANGMAPQYINVGTLIKAAP